VRADSRRIVVAIALGAGASALAGCTIALGTSSLRAWRVPADAAMAPTLHPGETVYTHSDRPHVGVGEIVIFHPPRGALRGSLGICGAHVSPNQLCPDPAGGRSSTFYIKRIAALGGARVAMFGGHLVVDGKVQKEPFARTAGCVFARICNYPTAVTIPPGYAFMLGDNRAASGDSRFWGPVPLSWIVGVAETCDSAHKHCHALGYPTA
jgi:signal peptidase I